jgi:hypothetical protein
MRLSGADNSSRAYGQSADAAAPGRATALPNSTTLEAVRFMRSNGEAERPPRSPAGAIVGHYPALTERPQTGVFTDRSSDC